MESEDRKYAYGAARKMAPWATSSELEDIVQDALVGIWRARTTWNSKRSSWSTWRYSCIRWAIQDGWRTRGWYGGRHPPPPPLYCMDVERDLESTYLSDDELTIAAVKTYIELLPKRDRIFIQGLLNGLPIKTIGFNLGLSPSWSVRCCKRAIARLRRLLKVDV